MRRIAGRVAIGLTAYYGLMISLYINREIQGSTLGRFLRTVVVLYYTVMIMVYLDREVFSEAPVVEQGEGDSAAQ